MDAIGVVRKNKDPRQEGQRTESQVFWTSSKEQQTSSANIFSKEQFEVVQTFYSN